MKVRTDEARLILGSVSGKCNSTREHGGLRSSNGTAQIETPDYSRSLDSESADDFEAYPISIQNCLLALRPRVNLDSDCRVRQQWGVIFTQASPGRDSGSSDAFI